jgi:hypothetical protein
MAVEYLYDAIRATSGEDINICALITDDENTAVTDNCYLTFFDDEIELLKVYGAFDGEQWSFTIPADYTKDRVGRYWYTIGRNFTDMCFKSPIYLI